MAKYIIEGGNKLKGTVKLSGNKNSILPCLAACLLTKEEVVIHNVPQISDVGIFLQILQRLGAETHLSDDRVKIRCKMVKNFTLPEDLVSQLRASILFVGPLLARLGRVKFSHPGGDVIGRRSIEAHLEGFQNLGFKFKVNDLRYSGFRSNHHQAVEIFLSEASVTATENLLLASVLGSSVVIIKNCAAEPHVADLCSLLCRMGAKIEGIGSPTLKIAGGLNLTGADFTIGSDYVEFGTYAVAGALTAGEVKIENIAGSDLQPVLYYLEKMGLMFDKRADSITVTAQKIKPIAKLHTNIWPGFPTDMMSVLIVLATQAKGMSLLHDWMYESRMFFADKLISMGANITIADPHRVLVYGQTKLYGRNLETPDIRAGMALVLAALTAQGKSVINRAELIERGYERVVEKLLNLGANIQRID